MIQDHELHLCLLDDLSLDVDMALGEYRVRYFDAAELIELLRGKDDSPPSSAETQHYERLAMFPWAVLERPTPPEPPNQFNRILKRSQLSYRHAGRQSWWPFDRLIRNLHLMKAATGPIMPKQFYFLPESRVRTGSQIDRVIYGEPETALQDPNGPEWPLLGEYELKPEDLELYASIDHQISTWEESPLPEDEKAYLRIALTYFENADRQLVQHIFDPFQAIYPLMSYEHALEALVIGTKERGTGNILSRRIQMILNDGRQEVEKFIRRVFWLRSKVAHGVRSPTEIRRLIVDSPDEAIRDPNRDNINEGPYSRLFLRTATFPPFLANLRDCTRRVILYYLEAALHGRNKEQVLADLR